MKIIRRGNKFEVIDGDKALPEGVPVEVYTLEDFRRMLGLCSVIVDEVSDPSK